MKNHRKISCFRFIFGWVDKLSMIFMRYHRVFTLFGHFNELINLDFRLCFTYIDSTNKQVFAWFSHLPIGSKHFEFSVALMCCKYSVLIANSLFPVNRTCSKPQNNNKNTVRKTKHSVELIFANSQLFVYISCVSLDNDCWLIRIVFTCLYWVKWFVTHFDVAVMISVSNR